MGTNHGGRGTMSPLKNLAQTWKNGKTHTKIEKFVIHTQNQAFIQDFDPRVLAEPRGVSKNLDPSPLQVGGHFPRECFQMLSRECSSRRGDERLRTLDQRLSGISQAVPPQPNGRTETGISRTLDTGNSSTDCL